MEPYPQKGIEEVRSSSTCSKDFENIVGRQARRLVGCLALFSFGVWVILAIAGYGVYST